MGDYFVCSKTDPVVETKAGKVRGFRLNTTYAFHGLHYAEADRFHPAVRQDFGPPYLWNVTSGHTVAGNKRLGKYTTAGIHSSA